MTQSKARNEFLLKTRVGRKCSKDTSIFRSKGWKRTIWSWNDDTRFFPSLTGHYSIQQLLGLSKNLKSNCFWSWCCGEAGGGFHICGADVILGWPLALVHFTNLTMIKGCEPFGGQLLLLPRHPIKVPRTPTLRQLPATQVLHTLQDSSELEEYRLTSKSFQLHQYYWPL